MNMNVFKKISNAFYIPFVLGYDILQTQLNHYDIPCDVAFEYCLDIYETYSGSIEAQQDKSEYECLQDYVNNHMHEIESAIIELAKKYSSIPDKKEKTKPDEIEKLLKPGPRYYDEDEYTDQTSRQIAEEKIREKALRFLNEEVPHGIYVEVSKFKDRKTSKKEDIYDIEATIYCKRESHKGIIIGKDGQMLKKIGQCARYDLERIFGTKINLKLWVKTDNKWDEDTQILKKFKYAK